MIAKKWRVCWLILLLVSTGTLLLLASLGEYARPQNDDYYYLAENSSTSHNNFNWESNGRLSSLLAYYFLYTLPHMMQIAPAISILLLVVSLAVFIRSLLRWQKIKTKDSWLMATTIASCLSLAVCFMLPGLYATFYWFAAVPPHTWSFCLVIFYAGLVIHRLLSKKWPWYIDVLVFLVLPFIIGTFYEAAALLLILISASALAYALWVPSGQRYKFPTVLSVVGSFAGLAFLLFSPGAIRRRNLTSNMHEDTMLSRLVDLPGVLWHNFAGIMPHYLQNPEILVIVFLSGIVLGLTILSKRISAKKLSLWGGVIILGTFIFVALDMCVVWIGLHEHQTVREYFSLVLGLVLGAALLGALLGQYASKLDATKVRLILGGSGIVIATLLILNAAYLPELRNFRNGMISYARLWDVRDAYIKKAVSNGECRIGTYSLPITGLWHLKPAKRNWVGWSAMREYYGLQKRKDGQVCSVYAKFMIYPFIEPVREDPPG